MTVLAVGKFLIDARAPFGIWLVSLIIAAVATFFELTPWLDMVVICVGLYGGFKWLSWTGRSPKSGSEQPRRAFGYLLLWPGMNPTPFHSPAFTTMCPSATEWFLAATKTTAGAALVWGVARYLPPNDVVFRGWVILLGLGLLLHFGVFHLLALAWRSVGIAAEPIMKAPLRSQSISEFWSRRWNLAFRDLAYRFVFRPLLARVGPTGANWTVFFFSGLVHELAISAPAQGGYGLPLVYFTIQAVGLELERSALGARLGLRRGWRGRLFAAVVIVGPAGLLFHRPFLEHVVLPLAHVIGAL